MHTLILATACLLNPDHQLLVVRKRGSRFWMLPGGKIDAGETAEQALLRELQEELQWTAPAAAFQPLGCFEHIAANEADTRIQAHTFWMQLQHVPPLQIAAEIEAMHWLSLHEDEGMTLAPLLIDHVLPALRKAL